MEQPSKIILDPSSPSARLLAGLQAARLRIEELEGQRSEPVAIVGLGCRFPGRAIDPRAFWEVLRAGEDQIGEVPRDRWELDDFYDPDPEAPGKICCRYGGFLRGVADFDPAFFRISRREAASMDPQQRLLLEVCWEALEDAAIAPAAVRGTPVGVFAGISTFDHAGRRYAEQDYPGIDAYFASGGVLSVAAGRISYVLGLTGPSLAVDTACSSSLVAVHLACQSLRNRECAMALAGGVNVILSPELSINFSRARMLAPDGRCKSFDAAADGYVRGEGCGVVVLKRLADALADGDRIMALIRGSAVNQDGPSGGLTVPSGPAQEEVIRQALARAGVAAAEVAYVEAHGTGTSLGDPIEAGALGKVFGARSPAAPLLLGSVKTNIGHLEAAAGISGLIKVVLSLQAGEIPPHLHFRTPNPEIEWEKLPLAVVSGLRKWPPGKKIAGVSSFAFMGTNAHLVLEEGPVMDPPSNPPERPGHLLLLSAKSKEALRELAGRYAAHIEAHPGEGMGDLCFTAHHGRAQFEERLAVVGASGAEIGAGCRDYAAGLSSGVITRGEFASGWRTQLQGLGESYLRGERVEWQELDRGYGRRKLSLPTYPFQRQRYWRAGAEVTPRPRRPPPPAAHPLLGARLAGAHRDPIFEVRLGQDSPAFLGQHQIYGATVFPATGYVEMALAAGAALLGSELLELEGFTIEQPLILAAAPGVAVQTILTPAEAGGYAFAIYSQAGGGKWTRHAAGRIAAGRDELEVEDLAKLRIRCGEELSVGEHYREFAGRGIAYGPVFQGLTELRRGREEALGYLQAPAGLAAQLSEYLLHPALFDAGLQVAGSLLPAGPGEGYFPVGIGKLRIRSRLPGVFSCHGRLRGGELDFSLYDGKGVLVAAVEGLAVKRATRESLLRGLSGGGAGEEDLYRVGWQPLPWAEEVAGGGNSGLWLILADSAGLGERLSAALRRAGAETLLVYPGAGYEMTGAGRYRLNPLAREEFARLFSEALAGRACEGILHLWSLDSGEVTDSAAIEAGKVLGCASVLHLVQALGRTASSPRLSLLTRGAQAVGSRGAPLAVHQAPLWGFCRTLALEYPELRSLSLDLDPLAPGEEVEWLLQELAQPAGEGQIAYRAGVRYGARLLRAGAAAPKERVPRRVRIREYGIIDNLALEPMTRSTPGRGEVELAVKATGLNFRDVLRALGMLKAYEPELQEAAAASFGFECSGVVAAVGEGVRDFQAGDEVIAALTAAGSLSSYTTVAAEYVVRKPEGMSHAEGATIPLAFLTAFYGLVQLVRIQPGEKVLIHAAAGGVGLAAVQIAQRAGAVIFATASPGKWEYLKSLGVERVLNSRTLDYVAEIKALTGGAGVAVILNSLTGEYIPGNLEILAPGGRFIEIGKIGVWPREEMRRVRPDVDYYPFDLGEVAQADPGLLQEMLARLVAAFEKRELRPLPQTLFPVEEAASAFRYMAQARHTGKVVLLQEEGPPGIAAGATYLITGGLGALGLETARWLAGKGATHLALAGRGAGSAWAREEIAALRETGVRVTVIAADLGQRQEVARLLEAIAREMPPLRGIVHGAGVLADGVLSRQGLAQLRQVMAPKADGAWYLHEESRKLKLDFFVCYSSIAAVLGSAGQANYAAANAFLDALVEERRRLGLHGLSINWGPWNRGMAAGLDRRGQERIKALGLTTIAPEQGLAVLARLLASDETAAALFPVDWRTYLSLQYRGQPPAFFAAVAGREALPASGGGISGKLAASALGERRLLLSAYVREELAAVLGEEGAGVVAERQRLFDLGIDSLMAVELKNRFERGLGVALPATLVFDYPTVEALVERLGEGVAVPPPVVPPPAGPASAGGERPPQDAGLAELSAAEIAIMLAKELG